MMAGLQGKRPSYDAFLAAYLDPQSLAGMPSYLAFSPDDVVLPDPTELKPGVMMTSLIGESAVPLYMTDQYRLLKGGYDEASLIAFMAGQTGQTLPADQALQAFRQLPAAIRQTATGPFRPHPRGKLEQKTSVQVYRLAAPLMSILMHGPAQ